MKELSPNLMQVIHLLGDGHFHSGDDLGQTFQVTRSAVWKIIKKIQTYGIQVHSLKGKGYALAEPLILLDKKQIQKYLLNYGFSSPVDIKVFACLNSTNEYLKTYNSKSKHLTVCLAEQQSHGKGRLNRDWYSPFGKNIYFSCRYYFNKDLAELAGLSLVANLATFDILGEYAFKDQLMVKWPSDLVIAKKKLAGNLVEIHAEANGDSEAIIGIGINVNMLNSEQAFPWTSLREATGHYIDRNKLCASLISSINDYLQRFAKHGFAGFVEPWLLKDSLLNHSVSVTYNDLKIEGQVLGVNTHGNLILKLANGVQQTFSAGDVIINA